MIVVVLGGSGSGKTEFCLACEKIGIPRVITNTSRARRSSDKPNAYHFRTKEEFEVLIEQGELLEYAVYNNNYYGITKDSITNPCIVVVEPQGYFKLREFYGDEVFMVYLEVSDEERARRALLRGDNLESVNARQETDKELFSENIKSEADLVLTDISLEEIPLIIDKYKNIWQNRG